MGRVFLRFVEAECTVHCCAACCTHLASHESVVSKAFQGRHGRAWLFDNVLNGTEICGLRPRAWSACGRGARAHHATPRESRPPHRFRLRRPPPPQLMTDLARTGCS